MVKELAHEQSLSFGRRQLQRRGSILKRIDRRLIDLIMNEVSPIDIDLHLQ